MNPAHDGQSDADAETVPLGQPHPTVAYTEALTQPLTQAQTELLATQPLHSPAPTRRLADASEAADPSPVDQSMALAPVGPGQTLRFGPGVPAAAALDAGQASAIWRGTARPGEPSRRRRALGRWLLPLLILIGVLALLLWQRAGSPIAVDAAAARSNAPSLTCGDTATITGTVSTNGEPGTITYRWKRSDGTVSDELRQQVAKGTTRVEVALLWDFHGQGTLHATATLEVLSPSPVSASTSFVYSCK